MKISVITVSLNSSSTIEDTIISVSSQKHVDVEHIIIDGGSTDKTIEIIKHHSDSIDKWISEQDKGLYDAMNKGLAMASGEIIGFLNADDVYADNNVLSKIARAFNDPLLDACYADLVYVESNNLDKVVRYWKSCDYRDGLFAKGWCPPHPTFFVRKRIYDQYDGFDLTSSIGNDIELMMRFLERCKIKSKYLPGIFIKMRVGGISNRSLTNLVRQNIQIIKAAQKNHIPINPLVFFISKIISRAWQYIDKPKPGCL